MKKILKIILWVIVAAILSGILIYLVFYKVIWPNISLSDRLKIAELTYNKCKTKNGSNCEWGLANNLRRVITSGQDEYADLAVDKTKPLEERMVALGMFYNLCREKSEIMDEQEGSIYFYILQDKENPKELANLAMEFLAGTKTNCEHFTNFQLGAIKSSVAPTETKMQAIEAIKESKDISEEKINALIKALEDPVPEVSVKAKSALVEMGDKIKNKIPELLEISIDKTKSVVVREATLSVINDSVEIGNLKDFDNIDIDIVEQLLTDDSYIIRSLAAEFLNRLTGKEYKIKSETEGEIKQFIEDKYGLIVE